MWLGDAGSGEKKSSETGQHRTCLLKENRKYRSCKNETQCKYGECRLAVK